MKKFIDDVTKEIFGAISLGILSVIFIIILVSLGNATGQNELVSQIIQFILILGIGIGLPIGVISLIKSLGRINNELHI